MKKIFLMSLLSAVGVMTVAAQSPEDYRYYINPGHGSWTGNDRPIQTIGHAPYSATNTDTTAFFESNTDLIKGFGALETLIEMGVPFDRSLNQEGERWEIGAAKDLSQQIVMSRVKNGPFESNNTTSSPNYELYNRKLSEICEEVNQNNFDIFISIHSNAATIGSSVNYHLFMYRGRNGRDGVEVQGSYEIAEAAAIYSFANEHACWSENHAYINGDYDFMHYYLGVLKHDTPGYLVEGYFHTYLPATHRGMNFDVDFEEGCAYARGIAEYFGFERETTGDIYGLVRDQHEKFTHDLYKPRVNSIDVYKPLNGAHIELFKDGEKINEYTTDDNYNGAFVFFNLEPGKYTITYSHPDYKEAQPVEVEVVPGNCVYPAVWLENKEWIQPDDFMFNYPDELGDKSAYGAMNSYNVGEDFSNVAIPELEGKKIRRVAPKGQKLYILALDDAKEPTIVVYDTEAKKVIATPSTSGMTGNQLRCSDIQVTAEGVLVACNQEKLQYSSDYVDAGETRGTLRFYRWENNYEGVPEGDPINFINTQNSSLWFRTYGGSTFAYQGSLEEGVITVANPTITGPTYNLRTLEIAVVDGQHAGESEHKPLNPNGIAFSDTLMGEGYRFIVSPLNDRCIWLVSSKGGIAEIENKMGSDPVNMTVTSKLPELENATGATAFKYAGHVYLTVPAATASGFTLYDVTNGLDKATPVSVEVVSGDTETKDVNGSELGTLGYTVVQRNEETNAITTAYLVFATVNGDKVSRYTTNNVEQDLNISPYAYYLQAYANEDRSYHIIYELNADADNVELILTSGDSQVVKSLGAATKGYNDYTLDATELQDGMKYNWAIRVTGAEVPTAGKVFASDVKLKNNSRGGVTWVGDTDSPAFGSIVTSAGYNQGISVYTPNLEKFETYDPEGNTWAASKVSSPFRLTHHKGLTYIVDWSDAGAGYWVFDPANPETTYDILAGERDSKGAHILDGKTIGGTATGIAIQGDGDDTYVYSYSEDYPTANGTMTLIRQKVGTSNPWVTEPEAFAGVTANNYMSGQNVEIIAVPDGIFVSQARAEGANKEDSPCFLYIDNDGNIKFNSSVLGDKLSSGGSGIAINNELNLMAITEKKTGIGIWRVEWNDNTPSFTKLYVIPGSQGSDEINQVVFDNAGNLYAWHRGNYGLHAYTIKKDRNVTTTAAPSTLLLDSEASVNAIIADDNTDAPVEYYDLHGMRIQNPMPGTIVLRRQGSSVTKFIVK
ncbi:MAG: carboxypeptidase regulatory-like domain-containing protein [Muribaculaceae bacterium]|nr:carboxypeptidase regulatory-like domain-containing protein [Muribaculaceae bacterium]